MTVEGEFEKNGCTFYALDECPMAGHTPSRAAWQDLLHRRGFAWLRMLLRRLRRTTASETCSASSTRRMDATKVRCSLSLTYPTSSRWTTLTMWSSRNRSRSHQESNNHRLRPLSLCPEPEEKDEPEPPTVEGEIYLTDLGNAKRFVKRYGNDIRYCNHTKKWYVWTGRRWAIDDKGAVTKKAKRVVQSILAEAAEIEDEETRKAYIQHERRSEANNRIDAMVGLAQSEGDVPVRLDDFDPNPMLLNTVGGTIDLETGNLDSTAARDMATKISPVKYDPEAKWPTWERFLNQVTAGNKELQGICSVVSAIR